MATPRKKPEDRLKVGRPTKYRAEYCLTLIEHMKQGGSLESYASKIPCAVQTVYDWLEMHPEFLEARKTGIGFLNSFYENLGKTIASGQLRRLKSEEPILDSGGNPVLDPKTGQVMYRREYEATTAGQSVFIFMTKNLLKWRDRSDIELTGRDGGALNFSNLSDEELQKKIAELTVRAQKK